MNKSNFWGFGIAAVLIAGGSYLYFLLYMTVSNIIKGLVNNDPDILSDNIDFPHLRENLKSQVKGNIDQQLKQSNNSQDPFSLAILESGSNFVVNMFNSVIDETFTPTGLGQIGYKNYKEGFIYTIPDAKYGYSSLNKFHVMGTNEYASTTLVLTRRGLDWELTNVKISGINRERFAKQFKNSYGDQITSNSGSNNGNSYNNSIPNNDSNTRNTQSSPPPSQNSVAATSRSSPTDFIGSHYADLNNRDYSATWNRLSTNFSSSLSYDDYTNWWDSVSEIQLNNITVISQNGDTARVKADLTYVMNDGKVVKDKKPFINLVWDDGSGSWLIDNKSG